MKDGSGACAVFAGQGLSASQVIATKVMDDDIARSPDCDGQAADAVSAYTRVKNWRRSKIAQKSEVRMSRCMGTSSTTHMAKIMG